MRRFLASVLLAALVATSCGTDAEVDSAEDETATSATSPSETGPDSEPSEATAMSEEASEGADVDLRGGVDDSAEAEPLVGSKEIDPTMAEPSAVEPIIQPEPGTLTAADVDDNLNLEFFGTYLERIRADFGQRLPSIDLSNRIRLEVTGADGTAAGNARLELTNGDQSSVVYTSSAGVAYIFPSFHGLDSSTSTIVSVVPADGSAIEQFTIAAADSQEGSSQNISLSSAVGLAPEALDVALVLDVTGSMSDELNFLTVEFESIIARLGDDYPNVDMRFGLVVYRDVEDAFVSKAFDFTGSIEEIRESLLAQSADGGGDFPEAMDQALADANDLSWRTGNVARVLILNADAPPHDNLISRTIEHAQALGQKGVRIYPLAASGVDDSAEYVMRAMAASTGGRHLFLTNDSGVGGDHQEPKTECYLVTRLDLLILRVLGTELAGERVEASANQVIRTVGNYTDGVCS